VLATVGARDAAVVVFVAWVHAEKISVELAIPQRIEVRTFRMSGLSTLGSVCFFRAAARPRACSPIEGPPFDDSMFEIDPIK
jgi:hypothetical protein